MRSPSKSAIRHAIWTATILLLITGCGDDGPGPDTIPPGRVADLSVIETSEAAVVLSWTAPGDDGSRGTAGQYDVRYSMMEITSESWASATKATGEPRPGAAGAAESFSVVNLEAGTRYYFALRTIDDESNESELSNVVQAITQALDGPSTITDLDVSTVSSVSVTLTWSAPQDAGSGGSIVSYDLRYSESTITSGSFDAAVPYDCSLVPGTPGSAQSCTVSGLDPATSYYFALKSRDNDGNNSSISNVVGATTNPAGNGAWVAFEASPNAHLLGEVYCLAVYNGVLYAGGTDLGMAGVGLGNIVYWNGERWFSAGDLASETVSDLFVMGGELHAIYRYLGTRYVASWDGQTWGTLLAPHSGINGLVDHSDIVVSYSGSQMVILTGAALRDLFTERDLGRLARWDGSTWEKFAEDTQDYPRSGPSGVMVRRSDGSFALAGTFPGIIVDSPHSGIVNWDDVAAQPIGGVFTKTGGIEGNINLIHEFNGGLLAFGDFDYVGGLTSIQSPAFWDGASWSSFSASLTTGVRSIVDYRETLVVSALDDAPLRLQGNSWVPMGNPASWTGTWDMAVFDGDLIVVSHNLAEQRSGLWRWVE